MKRVVLLGDSIRLIGYGTKVPELLGDGYEVWQPEDNGRFAQYTLRMLFDFRKQIEGADVIHWNNGHWDLCELFGDGSFTPLPMYVETMVRVARLLKQYGKKVIFATTTPGSSREPLQSERSDPEIQRDHRSRTESGRGRNKRSVWAGFPGHRPVHLRRQASPFCRGHRPLRRSCRPPH